jgi:hypothetical protein
MGVHNRKRMGRTRAPRTLGMMAMRSSTSASARPSRSWRSCSFMVARWKSTMASSVQDSKSAGVGGTWSSIARKRPSARTRMRPRQRERRA